MSKKFRKTPSSILDISDAYTAFCFDETCLYIMNMIEEGYKPVFVSKTNKQMNYSKPSDMYKAMGFGDGFTKPKG